MNTKVLTTVSAIAVLVAMPALAANTSANASANTQTNTGFKADVKNAWENVKDDTAQAYENIKAVFISKEPGRKATAITIDSRHTATGMIGKAVYNGKNERVGTLKDIIIDANGNASLAVIADGELPGFNGKLVAFDYSVLAQQDSNGDVIAPISEESISKAAEFTYDKTTGGNVRVIPSNSYAVSKLLDADLLNPRGEKVADIDNIFFKDGKASQLIVGFDKVLGLGGQKAALDFADAKIIRKDEADVNFQLSAEHAAQFDAYKKNATN